MDNVRGFVEESFAAHTALKLEFLAMHSANMILQITIRFIRFPTFIASMVPRRRVHCVYVLLHAAFTRERCITNRADKGPFSRVGTAMDAPLRLVIESSATLRTFIIHLFVVDTTAMGGQRALCVVG